MKKNAEKLKVYQKQLLIENHLSQIGELFNKKTDTEFSLKFEVITKIQERRISKNH